MPFLYMIHASHADLCFLSIWIPWMVWSSWGIFYISPHPRWVTKHWTTRMPKASWFMTQINHALTILVCLLNTHFALHRGMSKGANGHILFFIFISLYSLCAYSIRLYKLNLFSLFNTSIELEWWQSIGWNIIINHHHMPSQKLQLLTHSLIILMKSVGPQSGSG